MMVLVLYCINVDTNYTCFITTDHFIFIGFDLKQAKQGINLQINTSNNHPLGNKPMMKSYKDNYFKDGSKTLITFLISVNAQLYFVIKKNNSKK